MVCRIMRIASLFAIHGVMSVQPDMVLVHHAPS